MSSPRITPLKSEKITFLVSRAKNIAKREGRRERAESSMEIPKTLWP